MSHCMHCLDWLLMLPLNIIFRLPEYLVYYLNSLIFDINFSVCFQPNFICVRIMFNQLYFVLFFSKILCMFCYDYKLFCHYFVIHCVLSFMSGLHYNLLFFILTYFLCFTIIFVSRTVIASLKSSLILMASSSRIILYKFLRNICLIE